MRTERKDRKCTACQMDNVEDENHFLIECPAYQTIRPETGQENPSGAWITSKTFFDFPTRLNKFLRKAYDKRNSIHNPPQYIIKDKSPTGLRMTIGIKGRDKMKNTESLQIAAPVPIEEVKTVQRKTSDKTKTNHTIKGQKPRTQKQIEQKEGG